LFSPWLRPALKFGLYESLKPSFVQLLSLDDPTEGYFAASVAAGAVASIVLCPMEQTRIRIVTDPEFADGFVSGFLRLTKDEGLGAIFFGLPAMLSKQVPYVSRHFLL
jgi:solute carrier family 25 (mitochondrial phosphate transporter), member 3